MPEIAASHKSLIRLQPWRAFSGFRFPEALILPILVGPAYYLGTKLGLMFTPPFQPISTLWPPNALLFAVLLLTPIRTWPISLIAVLPAHLLVQLNSGIPVLTSLGWYVTNILEALLGASCLRVYCLRRRIAPAGLFKSFQGVICFVVFGVLLAPFLTSFLDASVVVSTGWGTDFWHLWTVRSLSNMLANLTLIPPIVVIGSERHWASLARRRYLEASMLALAILLVVGTVLRVSRGHGIPALIYFLLPFLLWAVVRFGSSGASTSLLFTALLSIWFVIHRRGPLALQAGEVQSLQIFLSAINIPLLCLAAVFEERRTIEEQLRRHQSLLTMVSQIGAKFINITWKRIDDEINFSLTRLRTFLDVDRVDIFEFTKHDGFRLCYTARTDLGSETPAHLSLSHLVWLIDELSMGKPISISDVNDLATDTVERRTLADAGIRSMLMVPLGSQPSLVGSLSVVSTAEKKDWPADLIPQLQILGEIFYDAMLRKDAFQALTESELRFQNAVDHSPMLVWVADVNGMCTYFNRGWLEFTGVPLEKQLGDGWTRLVHSEDLQPCLSTYQKALQTREQFQMEYRLRRYDGEYRWVYYIGAPRFNSQHLFVGLMGSAVDVTDRKNAEAAMSGLTSKLLKAQEEERQRIARELHDDIGQRLALLTIDLDRLHDVPDPPLQRSMLDLLNQANSISDCVRNMSHNLHSASLDLLPLGAALRTLCREFPLKASIEIQFEEHNVPVDLPQEVKLCLYRVAQEALHNIAKHSHAHHAKVELSGDSEGVFMAVTDDGLGFRLGPQSASGLGLASMRERIKLVAGKIKITSAPMRGTIIEAYVPLDRTGNPLGVAS